MQYSNFRGGSGYRGFGIGPRAISPFIKLMLMVNVAIFVIQYFSPKLLYVLGLTPARFFVDFPNLLYQPFTYMFLHGGFGHIFFNMFALWMFGTEIEFTWGTQRFARFYLLAGLSGALLTLIARSGQVVPMIGASAAIYGVLLAYWIMFPQRYLYIYLLFPVKVKWAIPGMMLLGFLFAGTSVAHWAHLGGAVFGLIYMKSDWRTVRFGKSWKGLAFKKKESKLKKNRLRAEETMKRVDEILDKINEVGIENISEEDRKFLEEASSHLSGEKSSD